MRYVHICHFYFNYVCFYHIWYMDDFSFNIHVCLSVVVFIRTFYFPFILYAMTLVFDLLTWICMVFFATVAGSDQRAVISNCRWRRPKLKSVKHDGCKRCSLPLWVAKNTELYSARFCSNRRTSYKYPVFITTNSDSNIWIDLYSSTWNACLCCLLQHARLMKVYSSVPNRGLYSSRLSAAPPNCI